MSDAPDEFRARASAWLAANTERRHDRMHPPSQGVRDVSHEEYAAAKLRQRSLAEAGLAGITWPTEYGGAGLGIDEQRTFDTLALDYDVDLEIYNVAINLVGPTLLAHGTEAQKNRYLAELLRGDVVWCQLFSEPGAGSDLASLSTRAELRDDGWHISGQKVWTSGGQDSQLAILVARSDFSAPKHRGLTYFLLDMTAPGVTARPLRQMNGGSHFAEVFLDDVVLPVENVVGEVGRGWDVVRTTLGNERVSIGGDPGIEADQLLELARSVGERRGDPVLDAGLLDEVVALHVRNRVLEALTAKAAQGSGIGPGPEASIFKLEYGELQKLGNDLAMRILGPDGLLAGDGAPAGGAWQMSTLTAPYLRIAGGTDEIQRNIIAERILGLPADKEDGRTLPFSQLRTG